MTPRYQADKYTYRVLWSEVDRRYVGVCSEFPALTYQAQSHAAALDGIIARVRGILDDMSRKNETIPVPLSIQRFRKDLDR